MHLIWAKVPGTLANRWSRSRALVLRVPPALKLARRLPWLRLELRGFVSPPPELTNNSFGIGSEVELLTALDRQKVLVTRPELLLALGEANSAVGVRIKWPGGQHETLVRPSTNQPTTYQQYVRGW